MKITTRASTLTWLAISCCIFLQSGSAQNAAGPQQELKRLKVGLVLSGGGARGVAHVGVLDWFERNRIPVDYLSGTSMGGLIGGVYAMGHKPDEIRNLIKTLDWDELFSAGPDFKQLAFRRKEDKRSYQVAIDLGYRRGLSLPLGVSSAHYIGLLLDRLTLPYAEIRSFDELPIPYRCVGADLLAARPVVMRDGPLSSAMRATMSIPAVFPPVERDGKVLVDGGVLENIPVSAIKEFKPDVIIAVDVGSRLGDINAIASLVGILQQTLIVMTLESDRRNLSQADIIVTPDLGELSTLDFTTIDASIEAGFNAAESKGAILRKFALSEEEWRLYLSERGSRIRNKVPVADEVRITGIDLEAQESLIDDFRRFTGRPLDTKSLEAELTAITGQGKYESLDYYLARDPADPGKTILEIIVKPKRHAPPAINFGVEIDGSEVNAINFTLGARVTVYDFAIENSEWRFDAKIGFGNLFATEYFLPLGERGFFIAPRATYRRERQDIFLGRTRFAEFQADRFGAGFDFGFLSRRSETRLGYEYSRVDARALIRLPELEDLSGNVNSVRARFAFDGQNSPTIPTRGLRFIADGRWFFTLPEGERALPEAELRGSFFHPLSSKGSFFAAFSGGTHFKKQAETTEEFVLGGPFRFGSYDRDELRVNHYFLATAGYMHKVHQLPSLVGGAVYGGAWLNQMGTYGGLTSLYDKQRHRTGLSIGLVMDTRLGPFSIVGAYGEGGRGKVYFSLGRFF